MSGSDEFLTSRKGEDRAEGLAAQSVNAGPKAPSQSTPDHSEAGDHMQSGHSLTGRNEKEEKDPNIPKPQDRYKP
jgi:hypothetical protein